MATSSPAAPTLSGTTLSLDVYLNNPVYFARLAADLTKTRPIGGDLLKGRVDVTGSGSLLFEGLDSLFADQDPGVVAQLGDYPLVTTSNGTPSVAETVKNGLATEFSDELASRGRFDELSKKTKKLTNSVAKLFDTTVTTAVTSSVTATTAATATFDNASGNGFRDIQVARAKIEEAGDAIGVAYNPDVVACRPLIFAYVVEQLVRIGALQSAEALVANATGIVFSAADGMTYLRASASFGSGTKVFVADSTMLGGIATENLGGGYTKMGTDPLDAEVKVIREDKRDGWHIQARKVAVPFVTDPAAGIWITGAHS
ncbi:hypothetical protein [Nocardioides sp. GY 10127]|uniref:phage major capsid protein n=1 Tax=Nocardioides sp. GY 10127 TaxID=2569762 RepID=UPI0010A783BB|nr:hypothetical protein [Nocardioides sp. GY 10127]TIC78784.1 hypothetical protein E8D37_18995 [Nocardioides sp. GY 10127]